MLQGLSASVTWYDIEYEDRIDVVPNTALANSSVYAPFITRRPPAGDVAGNAAFNLLVASFLTDPDLQSPVEPVTNINAIIDGRRANLGTLKQNGVDVNLAYAFDTSVGDWRVGLDWANIYKLERSIAPGSPFIDVVDWFGFPIGDRARASLYWRREGWQANMFVNFTDGYYNTANAVTVDVDEHITLDTTVGYEFDDSYGSLLDGLRLTLAVQDLTDEEPPVVLNGNVSWDNQVVSALGRQVSLTVTKSW